MRLRTQLFLGTTSLIVILLAVQAWLQTRQLRAMEEELSEVASWVTHSVINTRVIHDDDPSDETSDEPGSERHVETRVYRTSSSSDDEDDSSAELPHLLDLPDSLAGKKVVIISREEVVRSASDKDVPIPPDPPPVPELPDGVRVETDIVSPEGRFLVIKGLPSGDQRIQVPTNGATRIVQKTLEESVVASIVVLLLGMALVAVWSHRVTRPLRELATAAEAVGRGELGNQIPTTSTGELGELERAFNDMSTRLQVLTHERERWRAREHLAELGELSRGLGHTLRNPLHTLGLVVEELATGHPENEKELVATARLQIRRVDRWLQSFLAVGAGQHVEATPFDLRDIIQDIALEGVQLGANLKVEIGDEPLPVLGVPAAIRAALSNLVVNAIEASPPGGEIAIHIHKVNATFVMTIRDQGPGLPEEVRTRLFSPHVTTKTGGSGMGLFLARQILEGGHSCQLEVDSPPEGGTCVTIRFPIGV